MQVPTLQKDALVEILNVAIGRAAHALNQMVKEEIILSIPNVEFLHHRETLKIFRESFDGNVSAIKQSFTSSFSGDALLVFPEKQSLKLVQYIIGDLIDENSMTDMEQETMTEVGNVVLNACLSSLADQLGRPINSSIPRFIVGDPQKILINAPGPKSDDTLIMFIKVLFQLKNKHVSGYILLVVDMEAAESFLSLIDTVFSDAYGE